jgi:hypothetical protein
MFKSYHSTANIGLLKRIVFRRKSRELQRDYENLVQPLGGDGERPRVIKDDYEALSKGGLGVGKDLYLFLRSLRIADTIRFDDDLKKRKKSFEEVLSTAIDSEGERVVACVGNGGERWGSAQIHFDADWRRGIVPLFKSAVAIISMPSPSPACLEESYLIRKKKELLAKTLFVLPPLRCYNPPLGPKLWMLKQNFGDFQREMVRVHREAIGLHFPEPTDNDGYFVTMDFETGKVAEKRPWKIVKLKTFYKSGREPTREKFLSLDEHDIRSALEMVWRARGLRQSKQRRTSVASGTTARTSAFPVLRTER